MHPTLILSLVLAFFSALGHAHTDIPLYNRVSLDAAAQTEVETDLLVVVLFAQAEGSQAAAPADEVNRLMDWAMSMLKSNPDVKAQTLGYRSSAIYKDNKIRGWRVNQSLRLEGRDGRLLGDLISELQAQLKVQSIDYQVSDERRSEHLDELTAAAELVKGNTSRVPVAVVRGHEWATDDEASMAPVLRDAERDLFR